MSSLPIVALLTFDADAQTLAGRTAREAAERLRDADVAAIGANHGAGLQAALSAIEQMNGGDGLALAALPNIGLASLAGAASSIRTRRPSTSPSSRRTRAGWARA